MRATLQTCILIAVAVGVAPLYAGTAAERLTESATVISEMMSAPDKGIPQDLLADAHCVVVLPGVKKAAFILGGNYGRGFVVCRQSANVGWGAPAAVRMEGGSIGWQIGGSEIDVVMLVMDRRGMERLLGSKFTLGAGAEVAAGPVGRSTSAQTDARFTAKILTYSRSRGVFAGLSLGGATLRQDLDQNREIYGRPLRNKQIVLTGLKPPAEASRLLSVLNRYSQHES